MNFLSDFQQYYNQNVRPYESLWKQQQNFFERRIKDKRIVVILCMIFVLVLAISSKNFLWLIVEAILVALLIYSETQDKAQCAIKLKEEVVKPAIRECYARYSYSIQGVSEEVFKESNMYYDYDKFSSSDMVKWKDNGREFILSEIHLQENVLPNDLDSLTHNVFSGAFIKMEANYSIDKPIYIEPNVQNKKTDSIISVLKKVLGIEIKSVNVDNENFRKVFKVFFQDESATKILTNEFVEKILEIRNKYNAKIYFTFQNNCVYVMVGGLKVVDVQDIYENGISKSTLYGNLKVIQDIVDLVELVATKE